MGVILVQLQPPARRSGDRAVFLHQEKCKARMMQPEPRARDGQERQTT